VGGDDGLRALAGHEIGAEADALDRRIAVREISSSSGAPA
jgi:hypothetical protein